MECFTVTNSSGIIWSTSGTGTFSNSSSLAPTYTPSSIDTLGGAVTIAITSSGNSLCNAITETMTISFESIPTVSAGSDITECAINSGISLQGKITNSTGGYWTSTGTGTFGSDTMQLNATFYPSNADTASKYMELVLTSITNGICKNTADTFFHLSRL